MPDQAWTAALQFPVVVLVGVVAWYAYREIQKTHADHLKTERELRQQKLDELKESQKATVAGVRAEMTNLRKEVIGRLDKLAEQVGESNRRAGP